MKIFFLICTFFLISFSNLFAIDSTKFQQLEGLCKVWGFLKYYHPTIQNGKIDWDSVLIATIPGIFSLNNNEEYNKTINQLILSVGRVKKLSKPYKYLPKDTTYNNFDYAWISNGNLFSKENSELLDEVIENYKPGKNVYLKKEVNSLTDDDFKKYYNVKSYNPDTAHALLALFRYWNVINYFFAYRNVTDQNWNDVLTEFIPKIIESADSEKFYLRVAELATKLNDCHGFYDNYYFNQEFGPLKSAFAWRRVSVEVNFIENKTVITGIRKQFAASTGLKIGDIILAINGISIDSIRDELRKYCGCSTAHSIEREINTGIFMSKFIPKKERFTITFSDSINSNKTVTTESDSIEGEWLSKGITDTTTCLIADSIGFINLADMDMKDMRKAINKFKNTKALIFDLRNNSYSAMLPIAMRLPDRKGVVFANYYEGSTSYPGTFKFSKDKDWYLGLRTFHKKYHGQVIILINENIQSTYEWQLMSLKADYKITLIGSNTSGTDGGTSSFLIQENILSYYTADAVFYPDGKPTQRVGIKPDIYIEPTIKGLRSGRDDVLERAVEFINTGK